ncbi:AraC family ligand binding domain-containing protein [Blautia schinkii]|nr:AraC family ligand binding domain-containing protein [Blautia schinkii]
MEPRVKYTDSARYKCLEYLKQHSVELYLVYCGQEICDCGHSYGPAERQEYLLHYVVSGKGEFQAGERKYQLKSQDAFLIFPDEVTYYQADSKEPWTYIWIAFNGSKALECIHYAGFSDEKRVNSFSCGDTLIQCVNELLAAHQLTYANDLLRQSGLMRFLAAVINEEQARSQSPVVNEYSQQVYVDHALDYMTHNYHKNIKVSDIADYIGINRSYLTKSFKKVLQISPQEYLQNFRMNKAAYLLKATSLPVNMIAGKVGYSDALVFSKVFKNNYGVSPKIYRDSSEKEVLFSSKKYE